MFSISGIIGLIIVLVVLGLVVAIANYVVDHVPITDPLGRVIKIAAMVICALIAIIVLLQFAGLVGPTGPIIVRP